METAFEEVTEEQRGPGGTERSRRPRFRDTPHARTKLLSQLLATVRDPNLGQSRPETCRPRPVRSKQGIKLGHES